jgi:hypothetical protein
MRDILQTPAGLPGFALPLALHITRLLTCFRSDSSLNFITQWFYPK